MAPSAAGAQRSRFTQVKDPRELPWKEMGIDVVLLDLVLPDSAEPVFVVATLSRRDNYDGQG